MAEGFTDSFEAAYAAAARGDLASALERLLELWRERRAPALAVAIEALSARLAGRIEGRTLKERLARWTALEEQRRAADLGTLLGAMGDWPRATRRRHLEQLRAWPDDPRIARAMLDALKSEPEPGLALRLLEQHADPRTPEVLEGRSGRSETRLAAKLRGRFPAGAPALRESEIAALARFHDLVAPGPAERTEGELMAEVFARPDDDEPRLVLADLLLERGDLRGELIQLQCLAARQPLTPAQGRRATTLERDHRTACHGALAPIVAAGTLARGFLHRLRIKGSWLHLVRIKLEAAPEWATVQELDVEDVWRDTQAPLVTPHLERLRALVGLRAEAVIALCGSMNAPLRLETLGCFLNDHTHQMVAVASLLKRTAELPALRRLIIGGAPHPQEMQWLFGGSPLGRQLSAIELPHPSWGSAWLPLAAESEGLEELVLREDAGSGFERYGWALTLARDKDGRLSVASATHDGRRRVSRLAAPYLRLAADLDRLPPDTLSELRFGPCRGVPPEGRAELESALARQTRLATVALPR